MRCAVMREKRPKRSSHKLKTFQAGFIACFKVFVSTFFMILSASHARCDAASFPLHLPPRTKTPANFIDNTFSVSVFLILISIRFRFCFRFGVFLFRLLPFVIWFICQKLAIYQTISSYVYICRYRIYIAHICHADSHYVIAFCLWANCLLLFIIRIIIDVVDSERGWGGERERDVCVCKYVK